MLELNKIYCGDCLELMKQIDDNSIDLIITSPPYNKGLGEKKNRPKHDAWVKSNISYGEYKDNMKELEYQERQKSVLRECIRIIKPQGSIFYNHKARIKDNKVILPTEWLGEFIIKQMIIRNRRNSPIIDPVRFLPNTEYIYWIIKEQKQPKFNKECFNYGEVWDIIPKPEQNHPAPFPIDIPSKCILATTNKGDIVLDCFMGSGTTAVACKELGRNFIGIEKEQKYVDIANKRLETTTVSLF